MEEQGERKEEVLVVADSVLEEEEEWGCQDHSPRSRSYTTCAPRDSSRSGTKGTRCE